MPEPDDAWWLWERLVECDGLIVSSPIMSRTMAARLKLLVDHLLGPNADAAIIEELAAVRRAGGEPAVPFRVDDGFSSRASRGSSPSAAHSARSGRP